MSIREKALRVVLFLSAAAHLGAWMLLSLRDRDKPLAPEIVQACNRGYPFHYYSGDPDDPRTDPEQLHPYVANFNDYGIGFLVSTQATAVRWLTGSPAHVGPADEYRVCFLALLATALIACLPPVPFRVAAGATLGMHLLVPVIFLDYGLTVGYARVWGALTVFQCALFVVLGLRPRKGAGGRSALAVLGLLIAFSPIVRQSTASIPLGLLAALGLLLAVSGLVAFLRPGGDRRAAWRVFRGQAVRAAGLLLLLGVEMLVVWYAVLGVYSRVYHIPLAQIEMPRHGAGFPLYLSLGAVSNPYNIGWEDEIGIAHGQLAAGRAVNGWELQQALIREWGRVVRESPGLFFANVFARVGELGRLAFVNAPGTEENKLWREDNPWRAACLPALAAGALAALAGALVLLVRRPSLPLGLYLAGSLGAVLGANAPALLLYTGYPWDTCGSLIALTCVVLPAAWCLAGRRVGPADVPPAEALERALVRRVTVGMAACLVVGAVGCGVWSAARHFRNAHLAEALAARPDPLAEIHLRGYRYTHAFNRMSEGAQEKVLEALRHSRRADAFWFAAGDGRQDLFRPEVGVIADGMLYLVCRFDSAWRPPCPSFDEGPVNSYVHVVRDDAEVLGRWPFHTDASGGFHRVNDHFWDGRYRMLCLPCGSDFRPRETIRVGSFTIVGLTPAGWELDRLATGTLTRAGGHPAQGR